MSTEIDELKQARYRSDKTISGHNAFLRPPTGETNSVDTRGFYFVLKEPHPKDMPTWGFVNANFVTVPVSVVKRSLSDNAFEWCAKTEPEIRSNPAVNAKKTITLAFIVLPPD